MFMLVGRYTMFLSAPGAVLGLPEPELQPQAKRFPTVFRGHVPKRRY